MGLSKVLIYYKDEERDEKFIIAFKGNNINQVIFLF